jgi:hypothetical protein
LLPIEVVREQAELKTSGDGGLFRRESKAALLTVFRTEELLRCPAIASTQ